MPSQRDERRVILTDFDIPPAQKARLEDPRWNHRVVDLRSPKPDEFAPDRVDVMLLGARPNFRPAENMRNLKLVQTISAGIDHLDLTAFPMETVICSNVGAFAEPIAETVFAFILAFAKNLPSLQEELRSGGFPRWIKKGTFLKGKTLGVIGAGGIGSATAKLARAFGMKVMGIASRPRRIENFDTVGSLDDLELMLRESDFVVIAMPLTVRTRGLIDREKLRMMKKNAVVVNVARGPIVVEKDLYEHLRENPEFRAGIDVWWKYPQKGEKFRPDYPFFSLKNVLATPHSSAMVPEVDEMAARSAVNNVIRFFRGQRLRGMVNRADYASRIS